MQQIVTTSSTWGALSATVTRWAERSQQRACRNAMVASTALTQARAERAEVEEYVAGTLARRAGGTTPALPQQPEAPTGS